jgi:hypothetical protein
MLAPDTRLERPETRYNEEITKDFMVEYVFRGFKDEKRLCIG